MLKVTGQKVVKDNDLRVAFVASNGMETRYLIGIGANNPKNNKLADRLIRAIDGKAVKNVQVKKDIYNQEYVSFENNFLGRTLNADLKRIGY